VSSVQYLLRVVTVVTSVTIVPRSPRSGSACLAREEDCPAVASSSYGGREPEPSVSDNCCECFGVLSTSTGIGFQIRQARWISAFDQTTVYVSKLFRCSSSVRANKYRLSTVGVRPSSQIPGPLRGSPVKAIMQCQRSASVCRVKGSSGRINSKPRYLSSSKISTL